MSQSETKQKLINSAVKLFSQKGYFNTKVSDIVKDAGVAQGTFYLYFKSKEDIFLEIVYLIVSQIETLLEKYTSINLIEEEKIYNFGKETFQLLYKYKEIGNIFFFQLLCVDEKFKEIYVLTNKKIREFYINLFKKYPEKEIIADLCLSFGKKIFEFSILIENKPLEEAVKEFNDGIKIILRGLK